MGASPISISCCLALPTDPEAADFILDFELLERLIKKDGGGDPSSRVLTILAASLLRSEKELKQRMTATAMKNRLIFY
jgi:hypothetical protein